MTTIAELVDFFLRSLTFVRIRGPDHETVWLTQAQMVELFQTTKQNVSLHVGNVFREGELNKEGTVKEYLTVQTEGNRNVIRKVKYYKNRQVKRNIERFPEDFMFQLTKEEYNSLRCHFGTSNRRRGDRRALPYAFTQQGIGMLSGLLRSESDEESDGKDSAKNRYYDELSKAYYYFSVQQR